LKDIQISDPIQEIDEVANETAMYAQYMNYQDEDIEEFLKKIFATDEKEAPKHDDKLNA
jgi:hypothetical protein